jgi:glycosyltransferase involved in cell wall biosynthesis
MSAPTSEPLPFVSVVTPFYDTVEYLDECIQSVLSQTYKNFEYVLVNNRSTDGSRELVQSYALRDPRIRLLDNASHVGQVENHNRALGQIDARSVYCKIVQADDWVFPECLARMVDLAVANPTVGVVGAYTLLEKEVFLMGLPYTETVLPGREICRRYLLDGLYVTGSPTSTLLRADLVRARTKFYNDRSPYCDVEACMEVLRESDFGFVHQVLTFTRRSNDSITTRRKGYNSRLLTERIMIEKFGKVYLSDEEFRRRLRKIDGDYYRSLGDYVFRFMPREFWSFQEEALATVPTGLDRWRVAIGAVRVLLERALNPLDTVVRLVRGPKR